MINLSHDIKEVELILQHLGKGAYSEVAELINKIKTQAIPQVQAIQTNGASNPQVQADINQAEANSDSMRNE